VFQRLARVDAEGNTLPVETLPPALRINAPRTSSLPYDENPHQEAALYSFDHGGLASAQQLHGKELSYNNLVDLDAAWQLILEFEQPAAARTLQRRVKRGGPKGLLSPFSASIMNCTT